MVKKGINKDGKIHTNERVVHALNGDPYNGWSGTKSFGGHTVYEVERTMDWWPKANQEVEFYLMEGKAIIKSLGNILSNDEADIYCRSF